MAVVTGDGYAVAALADLGDGPGFRKIRKALGVQAFGINAVVLPAQTQTNDHWHDEQEETYFVHEGTIELVLGDGTVHRLGPGGVARIDARVVRRLRNPTDQPATYVCAGGRDGYVGRDGQVPEGGVTAGPISP